MHNNASRTIYRSDEFDQAGPILDSDQSHFTADAHASGSSAAGAGGAVSSLLDAAVGRLPVAIVVSDPAGVVTDANQAACDLLGLSRDRLVGLSAAAGSLAFGEPAVGAGTTGRPQRGVLASIRGADRANRWIQIDAVPSLNSDGSVNEVVTAMADVTPLVVQSGYSALDELPPFADITDQLANARLDPEAILATLTTSLSRARPGTWVAYLINKDPRTLRVVAANASEPQLARYVEEMHHSGEAGASTFSSQVIESGQPLLIASLGREDSIGRLRQDIRTYLMRKSPPVSRPLREIGVLMVPMRARGATVGALGLYQDRSPNPLTQQDVAWLQAIADRAGLAAENAQLYAEAVSRLKRLTALRSIGLAISSSPDLRLTLQVILDQVTSGLEVDAADVLLVDETQVSFVVSGQVGFQSTSIPEYRLPVDEQLPGRIVTRPHIETVNDGAVSSHFRRRTLFAREGFRAYSAAPLIARGRPLGVIELFHRSTLQPDDEWLGFLEALAGYAAIAIDAASLHDRAQKTAPRSGRPARSAPRLTPLERQILGLVVEGTTNASIAESVHLSESTVKFHVRQILQKVGVGNRTELARMATREGWL
jgi:PAS domain S-box-containing protein